MQYFENDKSNRLISWKKHRNRVILATLLITILTAVVADVFLGNAAQMRFYAKWISCGDLPYEARSTNLMNTGGSYYAKTSPFVVLRPNAPLYCTPRDAEMAGYSSSPDKLDFPYLTPAEAEAAIRKSVGLE